MSCVSIRDHFVKNWLDKEEKKNNEIFSSQVFPKNITEILDIPYINSGYKGHLLDIYYPNNTENHYPVIINIHGGGFVSSDKEFNKLYGYYLANKGFIVFNVNYRLAFKDTKIPGQIQDIISAFNWIGNNIKLYPANTEKIYVIGDSAGGYLATMAALVSVSERLQNVFNLHKPNIKINALAINCGFMELERKGIKYWGMRSMILEKGYKKQKYYEDLIIKNLPEIKNIPPLFITSNGDDELNFMTFYFVDVLKKNKLVYKYYYLEKDKNKKLGHCFNIIHPDWEESIKLHSEIVEYFSQF